MSLDIGEAFEGGISRTFARNGLLLAAGFAVVALVSVVLYQTFLVGLMEAMVEWMQGISPEEAGLSQQEYQEQLELFESERDRLRANSPLALGLPAGVAAGGLLVTALVAEVVSIVAVRVFAAEEGDVVDRGEVADGLALATLNGFVGGVVVWGLILVPLGVGGMLTSLGIQSGQLVLVPLGLLLVVPAVFLSVVFFFLRQEVALKGKNFVQALADSWRFTRGHRFEVFLLGAIVVVVSQVDVVTGSAIGFVSPLAGELVAALLGGLLAAFGAAVVTRAYVQLDAATAPAEEPGEADPYDAALGPDDIPE